MPLTNKIATEVGFVKTPATKVTFSIERGPNGEQEIRLFVTHTDGRTGASLVIMDRQEFGDLKELIGQVDEELAKMPTICRNCKTPIHSDSEFAESRGPCPFCGKVPTRF